jgi:hypothetical protein
LPPIYGADTNLPPLDAGISIDPLQRSIQTIPSSAPATDESQSISFNIPTLDFSLPPSDDAPASLPVQAVKQDYVDVDDLEKLFPSDGWKEPDFTDYNPYPSEKIEEPKPEDFSLAEKSDLPSFGDDENPAEEPHPAVKRSGPRPVDVFIRGRAYNRVFIELEETSRALQQRDAKFNTYEDLVKREEPLALMAKEDTEYIYKKLNQIDKKIFAS